MDYLVWYDPDPHSSAREKLVNACAAYQRRFNIAPNLVLVSTAVEAALTGVEVRQERTVQPHHFWVGSAELPISQSVTHEGEQT